METRLFLGAAALIGGAVSASTLSAEAASAEVAVIAGDPVYRVLEIGAIPAIETPTFVTGADADAQMRPEEPVLGVLVAGKARAYSLWQLDAHEIVNDTIAGEAIAVTW